MSTPVKPQNSPYAVNPDVILERIKHDLCVLMACASPGESQPEPAQTIQTCLRIVEATFAQSQEDQPMNDESEDWEAIDQAEADDAAYEATASNAYSRLLYAFDICKQGDVKRRLVLETENDSQLVLTAVLAQSMTIVDAISELTKAVKGLQPQHKKGCKCQT